MAVRFYAQFNDVTSPRVCDATTSGQICELATDGLASLNCAASNDKLCTLYALCGYIAASTRRLKAIRPMRRWWPMPIYRSCILATGNLRPTESSLAAAPLKTLSRAGGKVAAKTGYDRLRTAFGKIGHDGKDRLTQPSCICERCMTADLMEDMTTWATAICKHYWRYIVIDRYILFIILLQTWQTSQPLAYSPSRQWRIGLQGAAEKSNPLRFLAVYSAIARNLKAKFYGHM